MNKQTTPEDIQAARTLPQLLHASAANYGDDTAISLDDNGLSFSQLNLQSADIARGLVARGVGKGSRVGFILGNGPSFALMLAAIARIGAIAIPISTLVKSNELVRIIKQSDIAGLVIQPTLLGKDLVQRLCDALPALSSGNNPDLRIPETPYLRWIVATGGDLPASIHAFDWLRSAASSVSPALLEQIESEVHPTDQLVEIYTSGSMALPKGVKHTHGAVLFRTHFLRSKSPIKRGQGVPLPLPLFWVGGMMMYLLPNMVAGATTLCTEKTLINSLAAMGVVMNDDERVKIPEGYTIWALGMTETLGPYSFADIERVPGYPLCPPLEHIAEGFEVRVADEQDRPVNPGEIGEIQVRGYALTPGLHKLERADYFTADGFYRTGDLGEVEGNRILFVGRRGDMIKTASSNVSPAEVEMEMQQLEGIHSAYVVGIPDKERGQLVVAAVVPREGATLDFDQVETTLRERLSGFKVPRAYIAIRRDEVPMLASNKVSRRQIETLMIERLGNGK